MRRTKVQDVIERFLDSGYAVCEVTDWTHSSSGSCAKSLNQTARRMGYRVKAWSKGGKVFIRKEDDDV